MLFGTHRGRGTSRPPSAPSVSRRSLPQARAGFSGIVVHADSGLVDLWLVFQLIVESMERPSPLVAVQPVSIHPYSAAKMVASLGYRTVGRLHLNIVELEERELCDEHRRREVKPPCAASVAR
jgi:hypothetical protein